MAMNNSNTTSWCATTLPSSNLPDGFCAYELAFVKGARSVLALPNHPTDFLVLERGSESVTLCQELGSSGSSDESNVKCRWIIAWPGLNHGLELSGSHLYASSHHEVVRWPIDLAAMLSGSETVDPILDRNAEQVIFNINRDGQGGAPFGHTTRTLILDASQTTLYVSVGSHGNVDGNSFRSRVRRFDVSSGNENNFPLDFLQGQVFADGLRNTVGLAFDKFGVLWGVENGADDLHRDDLGGDIHENNPGEELNRLLENEQRHYGYPYCWSEFLLDLGNESSANHGLGTQWAWPGAFDNVVYTDEQCRDEAQFVPPALSMQAHSAPLGIEFYSWNDNRPSSCPDEGAFPQSVDGFAFIAFHGSWNRDVPTGYKVVWVPVDNETGLVSGEAQDLLAHEPPRVTWENNLRPVDVTFDACGRLVVSSDTNSMMVRIEYHGNGSVNALDYGNTTFTSTATSSESTLDAWLSVAAMILYFFSLF